ncbi:HAD hydrolase-like protein [Acidipila sp. 4G-K13]|uniref:phosphoglycolate phosphatase n=1 Tax=Paracidobacterium acidisoli TaxID=2303751 RepID=A0A372IUX2_9BACT|nr:HAD hydrolase-like protein [Paracidobacterium acidisoli]
MPEENSVSSGTAPTAGPFGSPSGAAEPRVYVQEGFRWDGFDAYLFDIDGTLLRCRDRIHVDSFGESVRRVMGYELSLEGVVLQGNTDPGILRDAFVLAKLNDTAWRPMLEEVLDAMRSNVAARRSEITLATMPGVEAALAHLAAKGALLGVATGNLESIGWMKIETAGLREWFRFGGFSDRFEVRAEMIAHAVNEARLLAGNGATVCVVGDTPADITAARANGLPTIAVATGHPSFDQLMAYRPEVCTTTLEALLQGTAAAQ